MKYENKTLKNIKKHLQNVSLNVFITKIDPVFIMFSLHFKSEFQKIQHKTLQPGKTYFQH